MRSERIELLLLLLLVCIAFASAAFALKPLIYRAEKTREMHAEIKEFEKNREESEQSLEKEIISQIETVEIKRANDPASNRVYGRLYEEMLLYNMRLFTYKQRDLTSKTAYELSQFKLTAYDFPNETFGIISIPAMELEMPLYLGASDENLANGAAVLSQTSIPIGGRDTNAVIAGHRGYGGYDYFRYIDKLEPGDEITIMNLWDTLTYRVTDIQIVPPDDIGAILIQPGKDMITLLTCHPYASGGKYRYLVYCERV